MANILNEKELESLKKGRLSPNRELLEQFFGMRKHMWQMCSEVMENRDLHMLSASFSEDGGECMWQSERVNVTVQVDGKEKKVTMKSPIPAFCRPENTENVRAYLQAVNGENETAYGRFIFPRDQVSYVAAFSYAGQEGFCEEGFKAYLQEMVFMVRKYREEIIDIATEHLNLPDPANLHDRTGRNPWMPEKRPWDPEDNRWVDDETLKDPVFTDLMKYLDSLDDPEDPEWLEEEPLPAPLEEEWER